MAKHYSDTVVQDLEMTAENNKTLTIQGLSFWRSLLRSKLNSSVARGLKDKGLEIPTLQLHPEREKKKKEMLVWKEQAETSEKTGATTRQHG